MERVPDKISFPKAEEDILSYWNKIDAFQTSLKQSEGKPAYTFYDGPPFATGLPHYGHILAGTIKDTVTRYAHQTGHYVSRRFGWDCHGLPVEFEIDKELGIKTRDEVLKMGIPKYNAACRAIVMRYSSEWEKIVKRLGRWIDFKNDYKTLDMKFMESVWWVFKEIYSKGLVYKGFKVMPYSTACTTPLSNFEANLAYKEVDDPAIIVSFPLVAEPDVSLLAWTTTPWTLPSNLALCVNPNFTYVKIVDKETKKKYIICENRLIELYKGAPTASSSNTNSEAAKETKSDGKPAKDKEADLGYTILEKYTGIQLKDKTYQPLFDYFEKEKNKGAFRVLCDGYVTDDSGTGIVHCAPAFGEDDYRVCLENNIIGKGNDVPCPVDANGNFTNEVRDWAGKYVKVADKEIIKHLKGNGRLVHQGSIRHSYPFCWRSDTPLIYKAVPSWFIGVEKVKDRLLYNNKLSYWVPDYVQEKRFHNWLADARDWAISRNRYWGTPIPIWISDDGQEIVVIGSVQELEQLTGIKVTDLHRESVDQLVIPSKRGPQYGVLKRIEEVFDCWFESGSMPYAQIHYPFENKEAFERGFPADFIAEGIDQTRGWFYTLLVISTVLYDKPPFKNLVVNGLVLASDGKKMSKRLKNYPDPMRIVNEYGADALRLYLINSPVVRAESLKFQEKGVRDVVKDVFLPWFNAYRFLVESVVKYNQQNPKSLFKPDTPLALQSSNIMDKWILAATNTLIKFVRNEMQAYRLYTVVPRLVQFIEQLTNWFVRLNRKRLKGSTDTKDCLTAISTLFYVILTLTKAMSPFTPFLTEYFYQNLQKISGDKEQSVHYLMFPEVMENAINTRIEEAVSRMQTVIQLARQARDRKNLPIKFPLNKLTVIHKDSQFRKDIEELKPYILTELNVKEVVVTADDSCIVTIAKPDNTILGKRLRKDFGAISKSIKELTHSQIQAFQSQGKIEIAGHVITAEELLITREYKGDTTKTEAAWDQDALIVLDLEVNENMMQEGMAREIVNRIQKLRKKAGIHPTDPIEVFYEVDEKGPLAKVINNMRSFIKKEIGVALAPNNKKPNDRLLILHGVADVNDSKLKIWLCRRDVILSSTARQKCSDDSFFNDLATYLQSFEYYHLLQSFHNNSGKRKFVLNGSSVELELGKDIFASVDDLLQSDNNK